jgi:hypothetical protein
MRWFHKREKIEEPACTVSDWKEDYSDCVTRGFIDMYSICLCPNNHNCRHLSMYGGSTLCNHPRHESFIPEGSEPVDPHEVMYF